jgi:endonuclease G
VRGRLAAASNHRSSKLAHEQTYLLSNVAPMLGEEFRMSFWVHLEKTIRAWARNSDELYVYTGPIYASAKAEDGKTWVCYTVIGENRVAVPTHYFKVILRERGKTKEMLALVIPHKALTQETPLADFLASVDEVERLSGLDFFPKMTEPTQSKLEAAKPEGVWGG